MFHIFHFLQCNMVLGIVNPLSWIFHAISNEKSCLISMPFLSTYNWREDSKFFPACWILIGQFKFPSRQPFARKLLMLMFMLTLIFLRSCDITWQWRQWTLPRDDIFQIQLSLADGNFESFSFSAYFYLPFSFNSTSFCLGWSLNA